MLSPPPRCCWLRCSVAAASAAPLSLSSPPPLTPNPAPVPRLSPPCSQAAVSPAPGKRKAIVGRKEGHSSAEKSHCRAKQSAAQWQSRGRGSHGWGGAPALLGSIRASTACSHAPLPPPRPCLTPPTHAQPAPAQSCPWGRGGLPSRKRRVTAHSGKNHCRAMRGVLLRRACRCPFPPVLALTPHPQASAVVRGQTVRAKYWYTAADGSDDRQGRSGYCRGGGASLHCQGLWLWAPGLATSTSAVLSSSTGRLQGPNMNIHGKIVCSCPLLLSARAQCSGQLGSQSWSAVSVSCNTARRLAWASSVQPLARRLGSRRQFTALQSGMYKVHSGWPRMQVGLGDPSTSTGMARSRKATHVPHARRVQSRHGQRDPA